MKIDIIQIFTSITISEYYYGLKMQGDIIISLVRILLMKMQNFVLPAYKVIKVENEQMLYELIL